MTEPNSSGSNAVDEVVLPIANIAAYKFVELDELERLRDELKQSCKRSKLLGTILLSPEGINLFLAGQRSAIAQFLSELRRRQAFADLEVKFSYSENQPFNRMLVKIKREIIAFGVDGIAPAERTSPKLPARQLKQWLDEGRPVRLLDTRNDYEVDLGTFSGAERLGIQHFRDFPSASRQLPEEAKQEPLVMFCTGGIRCEKAGPMLEQLGFQQVYQLEGGILKYFEECGGAHYDGGCFVFDSRVVLGPDLKPTGAVQCFNCQSVLTHEDIQSPKFSFGKSCPHCYRTPQQQQTDQLVQRQSELDRLLLQLPGKLPYDNRRVMHVAARFAGWRLIDFLSAFHPPTPPEQWLTWLADESITSNGVSLSPDTPVREGQRFDQVQIGYTEPDVATDVRLIYEDEAMVVVDKPAPLPVHPSGRFNRHTLTYFLSRVYRPEKLRVAGRLDAATTGLVVLARKYSSARVLQPQFAQGQVSKRYLLRVVGHPTEDEFSCCEPIGREPGAEGRRQMSPIGDAAETRFWVRHRFDDGTSLLEAQPVTGRTHQIRLHARHMGHAIVGDALYGVQANCDVGNQSNDHRATGVEPLCLHCWQLSFAHPYTGQPQSFTASLPQWAEVASVSSSPAK